MCFGEVFSVCFCIRKMRFRARHRKNVNDCYSMGLSACGCETRAAPSNSLATTALFTSWNNANALNVFSALSSTLNKITQTLTTFCDALPAAAFNNSAQKLTLTLSHLQNLWQCGLAYRRNFLFLPAYGRPSSCKWFCRCCGPSA